MRPTANRLPLAALLLLAACSSTPVAEVNAARAKALREQGDEAARGNDFKSAAEYYTRSIEANPQSAEPWYLRGKAYVGLYKAKDPGVPLRELLDRAAGDFGEAIRLNPVFFEPCFDRAMILLFRKAYKEAAQDLIQCAGMRPKDPESHLILAEIYEEKFEDRLVQSMDHYEKYVELGGRDETAREKVRKWRELKKSLGSAPAPGPKPTVDDEKVAAEQHAKATGFIGAGKRAEAMAALDELLAKYGHTRYVKERAAQFAALRKAFAPPAPPK